MDNPETWQHRRKKTTTSQYAMLNVELCHDTNVFAR